MSSFQWLCIPFAWTHPAVGQVVDDDKDWIGSVPASDMGLYFDYCLLLVFGGIPWQVRLFSRKKDKYLYCSGVNELGLTNQERVQCLPT